MLGQPAHATRLRLDIHPDGGVARLRVLGRPDTGPAAAVRLLYLNSLFDAEARTFFHTACASTFWVDRMNHSRPFASPEEVLGAADDVFDTLEEADWLDAFAGHPRIGERGDETANREQGGTADADAEMLAALAGANRAYEEAHGFTYIVYATGKKAEEMLEIARRRLHNSRVEEIAIAAGEQRVITRTRLRRMLCMGDST